MQFLTNADERRGGWPSRDDILNLACTVFVVFVIGFAITFYFGRGLHRG
jgi:hypothetical protein